MQTRKSAFPSSETGLHLDLALVAFGNLRNKFLLFKLPSLGMLWQSRQTDTATLDKWETVPEVYMNFSNSSTDNFEQTILEVA